MKTIYQLQQIAARLRAVTEVDSISPEDTFGLQADVLEYLADMEQNAEGLGIHKVYASYSDMVEDGAAPVGSNGKLLRYGQLVIVYDAGNPTQNESGNVYAWQKGNMTPPWLLMGNLGSVYALQSQIDDLLDDLADEERARMSADSDLSGKINTLRNTLDTLMNGNVSDAIESFNEILNFLEGITDDESLAGLLSGMSSRLSIVETKASVVIIDLSAQYSTLEDIATVPAEDLALIFGSPAQAYALVERRVLVKTEDSGNGGYPAYMMYDNGDFYHLVADLGTRILTLYIPDEGSPDAPEFTADGSLTKTDLLKTPNGSITVEMFSPALLQQLQDGQKKEVVVVEYWPPLEAPGPMKDQIREEGIYFYYPDEKQLFVSYAGGMGFYGYGLRRVEIQKDTIYVDGKNCIPYIWDGRDMKAIAPKNTPASIFNATNEVPVNGYYVLCDAENRSLSAVHAAWDADKAVNGLILSFEIGAGIWKTYQYIGKTVTEANWTNEENWKDFGSLAAGSEPYIIMDSLVGPSGVGAYYTLATAVQALIAYQERTKVTYAKKGLIISYATGENQMETKQF